MPNPTFHSETAGSRWWDYYAVRYAMGVGSGTPLAYLLWHHYRPLFELTTRIPTPFTSPLSAILWAAVGLTFCYISSVPMLTIHTVRVFFKRESWKRGPLVVLTALLVLPSASLSFWAQLIGFGESAQRVALIGLWLVFSLQMFLIVSVAVSPGNTKQLYDKLADNRPGYPEFVESYRHMREHGNSVLIVLGEFWLTFCLWEIHPIATPLPGEARVLFCLIAVLTVWLLPGSLVWVVGTRLELHLAEKPRKSILSLTN